MAEPERPRDDNSASSSSNNNFRGVCPTGDYSALGIKLACDPQASSDGHESPAARCSQEHYVPVTTHADSSAGDRCPQPEALFHELWAERCAGPGRPVHPTGLPATSACAGARCDRLALATGYALSIYGTDTTSSARLEPATATAMAGPISSVRRRPSRQRRWRMQLKGVAPALLPRR